MVFIFLAAAYLFFTWRWADWRNWRAYYPTLLYMMTLNFIYCFLTYKVPLWEFERSLLPNRTLQKIAITFISLNSCVLLFLSNMPKKRGWRPLYMIGFAAFLTSVESFASRNGLVLYENGWSIGWSALFDLVMFPLLYLHDLKPLLSWPLSILCALLILWKFGITPDMMK